MRKATRRKHRPPAMHPLDVLAANQPFPEAELNRILLKVHDAFAHLRGGGADVDLFDRMACVLNVGMVRSEAIGQAGVDLFLEAQAALMEADAIYGRHGKYGFTGPGLDAMRQAVGLYEEILRASTPLQMARAQEECMRRVLAGQVMRAEESTKQKEGAAA